ncbi:hypothetical protein B0J15DRAFT_500110 [Fusarium solani]|uniref:Geranylgeranyl pyrophosphate synthetase n=1 Tax=Fusarium solani TaxID=169388 RepID=A0A9P9K7R4_FUSSL|nr:uncharacterized protein B0J15DRAFT_500110 [Fusarium solani]KAH7247095.1 hypothetical protein B0J15DRAFT_500110 [Fusarium solani]
MNPWQRTRGRPQQPPAVTPSPSPPLGDLIENITRDDLDVTQYESDRAEISNAKLIASYNWVSASSPEIIVPGQPPRWTPPRVSKRLPWDTGEYYRDMNAASYPKHPLEPAIISVMKMNPKAMPVNIVGCGSTIGNLLRFARGVDLDRPFRILVELVGDTVHLIRRENSPKELIPGVRGYGHTFPEAYTTWDSAVRRSTSHQRIMAYRLGGLDMMVRFEGDGFIKESKPQRQQSRPFTVADALAEVNGLALTKPLPILTRDLKVSDGGETVPQETIFDLKTRSVVARFRDTLGDQLPRLWISQVTQFILAYHEKGLFQNENIEIKNVTEDIDKWEELNQPLLKRLVALLHLIIDRARASGGKIELVWSTNGPLEIRKQLPDAGDVLSASVREEWEAWLGKGEGKSSKAEKRDSKFGLEEPTSMEEFLTGLSGSDGYESDDGGWDYTACDKECGYCGKCPY